MGAALVDAALRRRCSVTLICGPVSLPMPTGARRIDVETAQQMHDAVMAEWPGHDLLIMAAAVADYRPVAVSETKLSRSAGSMALALEPTPDIAATASSRRQAHQRIIGFSLEREGDLARARQKLSAKKLDMIVFNPLSTMNRADIEAVLLWPDGKTEQIAYRAKGDFADTLLDRARALFG